MMEQPLREGMESTSSLPTSDENNNNDYSSTVKAGTSGAATSHSPAAKEEEEEAGRGGCRKSSRLKAKMSRQSQAESAEEGSEDAYNLRLSSLVKRVQTERRQSTPRQPKGKSKPPPLSKYRRRTANARERMRMKEINEGFERLREALPDMELSSPSSPQTSGKKKEKKEKPTKLTVLNLALNYIHALRDILGYPALSDVGGDCGISSNSEPAVAHGEESDLGTDPASTSAGTLSTSSSSSSSPSASSSSPSASSSSASSSSTSSASCGDEICSNPSPESSSLSSSSSSSYSSSSSSSVLDMKDFALSNMASFINSGGVVVTKDLTMMMMATATTSTTTSTMCDMNPASSLMEFQREARSSPSSSSASDPDPSLPPTPPPLGLPEEYMDIDQSDLLDVNLPLEWGSLEDIIL